MIKVFGVMDILSGITMILLNYFALSFSWIFAVYIIIKSLIFISDITSIIDLIAAGFFILAIFGIHNIITIIFAIWLLQKGFLSLLA